MVINLLVFSNLTTIYFPEKFRQHDIRLADRISRNRRNRRWLYYIARIPAIFIYTSYVFWGLKLDLKEVEIRKPVFFAILIIEYLMGLICIAYIANYIISK